MDATRIVATFDLRERAHAPYSKFHVGAAILTEAGAVHVGANVENASYPMCVCAERNAIAAAVNAGARRLHSVVVCTDASPPSSPVAVLPVLPLPVNVHDGDTIELECGRTYAGTLLDGSCRMAVRNAEPPMAEPLLRARYPTL